MNDQFDAEYQAHMDLVEEVLMLIAERLAIINGAPITKKQVMQGGALCTNITGFFLNQGKKLGMDQATFLALLVENAVSLSDSFDATREAKSLIERVKA